MITYMPEIYPDELVYSWFCRYAVNSGNINHKTSIQNLFCKRSDTPSKEFIGNLNSQSKKIITQMYSLDDLILHHTMFPQYARFVSLNKKIEAFNILKQDSQNIHTIFKASPISDNKRTLKFCPCCIEDDRKKYGETYWHREHQIKNNFVCIKHKCFLQDSNVPIKNSSEVSFHPAELYCDTQEPNFNANDLQIKFSEYINNIFKYSVNFKNNIPVSTILYYKICESEYIKSGKRCKYTTKMANDILEYYSHIKLDNIITINQIYRILSSKENYDFSLICQIAFFLNINIEELLNSQLSNKQIEEEDETHYIKKAEHIDWKNYDLQMTKKIKIFTEKLYYGNNEVAQKPTKITEALVFNKLDIPYHRLENMPKCKKIIQEYTETYEEFWVRKIVWAYNIIIENKNFTDIHWTDIRKLTCIKKRNLYNLNLNLLYKYMYKEDASNLIKIIEKSRN